MADFVQRRDVRECKTAILQLFERNGEELSSDHFDWYYQQACSISSWILQTPEKKVVGLCSVVPRTFRFGEEKVKAGIVGNLMVDEGYRAIGGLALVRSVQSLVSNGEFDVLLGIPTVGAPMNLSTRMGFRIIASWRTYFQVFRSRTILHARYGTPGALVSRLIDSGAAMWRRVEACPAANTLDLAVQELTPEQVTGLAVEGWALHDSCFVADFSTGMLQSRFLRQPLQFYKLFGVFHKRSGRVVGYLVADCQRGRVLVCECRTDARTLSDADAIAALCCESRLENGVVGVLTLQGSRLSRVLARSGFLPLPRSFGGSEHSLLGFWRPDHRLASFFNLSSCWNVLPGFNDV